MAKSEITEAKSKITGAKVEIIVAKSESGEAKSEITVAKEGGKAAHHGVWERELGEGAEEISPKELPKNSNFQRNLRNLRCRAKVLVRSPKDKLV